MYCSSLVFGILVAISLAWLFGTQKDKELLIKSKWTAVEKAFLLSMQGSLSTSNRLIRSKRVIHNFPVEILEPVIVDYHLVQPALYAVTIV